MSQEIVDVLIVGAGPVGLFCANELTRQGLQCRIIEKKATLSDKSKALGLHIRTLDVFKDCDLLEQVLAQGYPILGAILKSKDKQLAELTFDDIGANRNFLIDLPQDKTERLLYEALLDKKGKVEWETQLLTIAQKDMNVVATISNKEGLETQLTAHWVIACDGAHSTLRQQVNAEFIGFSYPQTWWLADLHIKGDLPEHRMVINASEHGPLACFPMGNQRYRIVMTAPPEKTSQPNMGDIIQAFNERCGDSMLLSDPVWITAFSIQHRQIQHYRYHRVFFCGDAAHVHSPMGGQGLNTGIQDVYNLAWKLALVQKKLSKETLLDSHHEERYPIGKKVLKKTDIMTKIILLKNHYLITIRNHLIKFLTSIAFFRKSIAKDLAELNISYAKSSIVKKIGKKTGFKLGEFIPLITLKHLATSEQQTLETICQGTKHHLFLWSGQENQNIDELAACALALSTSFKEILVVHLVVTATPEKIISPSSIWIDSQSALHKKFKVKAPCAMLVRPDKYIGLLQSPVNQQELQSYFEWVFI